MKFWLFRTTVSLYETFDYQGHHPHLKFWWLKTLFHFMKILTISQIFAIFWDFDNWGHIFILWDFDCQRHRPHFLRILRNYWGLKSQFCKSFWNAKYSLVLKTSWGGLVLIGTFGWWHCCCGCLVLWSSHQFHKMILYWIQLWSARVNVFPNVLHYM